MWNFETLEKKIGYVIVDIFRKSKLPKASDIAVTKNFFKQYTLAKKNFDQYGNFIGCKIKIFMLFSLQGDVDMEEDWTRNFHDLIANIHLQDTETYV